MVFFLIEDAVAPRTLASKLCRQATKWNGHEAFVLLRDGYVFNGPQTATILLAELSKIRLQRDEDASSFCLRLIELIEDLELVPGDTAVFLTDTQKLGYLLSAIRHETGLQAERTCPGLYRREEAWSSCSIGRKSALPCQGLCRDDPALTSAVQAVLFAKHGRQGLCPSTP
jgi:hypothetical protein